MRHSTEQDNKRELALFTLFSRTRVLILTSRTTYKKGRLNSRPFLYGAPGEIRTPDPLVRSQVLYPAELRARYLESRQLCVIRLV